MSAPPQRLGRYTIVRRLGAGGMAEVFLARSRGAEGTDKLLVVKRILPAFAANARFRAMFVDEARVALRLNHPNVVQVYGFESDGPTLLLVMEHLDGADLAALAQRAHARGEKLAPTLCAYLAREVARGLHYAHERRGDDGAALDIVHRDVSPGNVLLSYEGAVKLGDFGIARARSVSDDDGALKGKFQYMAPEQARTEPVDRRADVYSLGVLLGELLAGRALFEQAAGPDALARLRRGEALDLRRLGGDVPEPLRELVARATAPRREDRPATAREVSLELTRALRALDAEVDAASVEHALHRYLPRGGDGRGAAAAARAALDEFARGPGPEAQTIARANTGAAPRSGAHEGPAAASAAPATGVLPREGHGGAGEREARDDDEQRPARPSVLPRPSAPPASWALEAGLVRERVHVTVLVGRIVPTVRCEDTLDTRPLYELIEALAFKADATLERDDDGRFALVSGVLRPHVGHAIAGARLALDVAEAASSLAGDAEQPLGVALGLARGVAAVARGAAGSLLGYEIVDEALSFATSLADAAAPGELLATAGLYRLVRRAFVLVERPPSAGLGARVFSLERAKNRQEREADVTQALAGLVGRAGELAALRASFERARAQHRGGCVLVTGELGVGKSALLAALAAEAEQEPATAVLRVSVPFGAEGAPYRLVAALLTELLSVADEGDPAAAEAAVERAIELSAISHRAGQRAARRALRVALRLEPDERSEGEALARELALVLRRLLTARALLAPVLVLLDGLELADAPSRAALVELARKLPPAPVLLVLAARDAELFARSPATVELLRVGPLTERARAELIAARLGAAEVSDELSREVGAAAGGNPLMILEVLEALSDRGRLEVRSDEGGPRVHLSAAREGDLPLPATLEEVLAARIDALPAEARALARWCALVDAELPYALLEALAGDEAPRAVGRLLGDGILVRAVGRRDVYTFAHAALARVARASIDPTQRAGMHARIATLLERGPNARGAGAGVVALHREAAGAVRPAARAWLECATAQRAAGAHREALGAYARVLSLCDGATDPEGFALRFAAHSGREEIARGGGYTRARRAAILAMRSLAVGARDRRLVARALARQARYKLETGLGAGLERDVAAAVRAARATGEARTEAEARRVLGVHLGQRGRYAEALLAVDEALAALETRAALLPPPGGTADDGVRSARTVRAEALLAKGALLRQTGAIDRAVDVYAEAYALLQRFGPRRLLAHALNALGVACHSRGDYGDALRLYLASIAVQRESGQRDKLGMALSNAGQCYAALGEHPRAMAFLRKAVEVFAALGAQGPGSAEARAALAELHAQQGDTALALAELERAREDTELAGSRIDRVRVQLAAALVALARGDVAAARSTAEEAERGATEAGIVMYAMQARAYAAEAAARAGDLTAARRYVEGVLSHPQFTDPTKAERGDLVLRACERALRALGEHTRAASLHELALRRRAATRAAWVSAGGREAEREHTGVGP